MTLSERKMKMIDYLRLKLEEEDWHGVADAAMDLREIEVELKYENKSYFNNAPGCTTPCTRIG